MRKAVRASGSESVSCRLKRAMSEHITSTSISVHLPKKASQ